MAERDVEEVRKLLADSFTEIGRNLTKLNNQARDAAGTSGGIGRLDGVLVGMAKGILGPVGVAAAFYQISNALTAVAEKSVQMQAFSRNVNLSSETVKDFQKQMRFMGMSSEEALGRISAFASKMDDLEIQGRASNVYQSFLPSQGGAQAMEQVLKLIQAGDRLGAMKEVIRQYRLQETEAARGQFAATWGLTKAIMDEVNVREGVRKAYAANIEDMKKYITASVEFSDKIGSVWESISGRVIHHLNEMSGGASDNEKTMTKIMGVINTQIDETANKTKATIEDIKAIYEFLKNPIQGLRESNLGQRFGHAMRSDLGGGPSVGWDAKVIPLGEYAKDVKNYRDYPQAEDPMGTAADYKARYSKEYWERVYRIGPYGKRSEGTSSGATDFSGMRRRDESIQEQQTTILEEIRDTLQGKGPGSGGSGGGGSGGGGSGGGGIAAEFAGAGGGRGGLARYLGMGGTAGGPVVPGVGAARGRVGAGGDPRGMESYIREAAKARGIDPDTAVAVAKSEGLSSFQSTVPSARGPNGREDSWGAFQLYKGGGLGNEFQKKTGLDPADPANERATIDFALDNAKKKGWGAFHGARNTGIGNWAGINSKANSPGVPQAGGSGDGLPSAVIEEARKVAAREGNGESVQNYIRSQGYNVNSAWCGDFAASVVRGSGGTPPKGHSIASNWRNYGQQVDNPQPGDIAVRRGARTGQTGSHVTIVDSISDGRFVGLGGNQSSRRADFRQSHFEFFRGQEEARARMDAQAAQATKSANGSISAKVEFTNVPPGVKTSAEADGDVFEKLQINKSRTGEVVGGTPGQPYGGIGFGNGGF